MKKVLIFLGGVVTGILLTILFAYVRFSGGTTTPTVEDSRSRVTMFEKPGDVINETGFEVFQALEQGSALARGKKELMTVYLLVNDEGKYYYDDEKVKVPSGKVARQVGIYQYETSEGRPKTVPVVKLMEK